MKTGYNSPNDLVNTDDACIDGPAGLPHGGPLSAADFDPSFKIYYELMAKRVAEILLVSSPYDAFIMEEEGRLAERIIHEYRGLNLTRPPRLTWVSNAQEAFSALADKKFDLVITMPRLDDLDPYDLGLKIKSEHRNIPVILLSHNIKRILTNPRYWDKRAIDKIFVWFGNSDLLLALVKSLEDRMNVDNDTRMARVRVIVFVEDSPVYLSSLLPLLYKEIVSQTNAVMEESLNEEHRILRMRARPKILLAETYEEAEAIYEKFRPFILSVFSDIRFPRDGALDQEAGFRLLSRIKAQSPDLPLLMLSSEEKNRARAEGIPAVFIDKNSDSLHMDIRAFLKNFLGFGDFIFRTPEGVEVARANNIRSMEKVLPTVPDASVYYHALRNDFSSWLMARSEIRLASRLRPVKATDFPDAAAIKKYLIHCFQERRKVRQSGVVADFICHDFDPETDFMKIGKGSLGGKARGLAFMAKQLKQAAALHEKYPSVDIGVPKTLVISTEGFDAFMAENNLKPLLMEEPDDDRIQDIFLESRFPDWLARELALYLEEVRYPLAVRSSSLLEDAQYQSCAGIYRTCMIPNNHSDPDVRRKMLINAVKLVYASTFLQASRGFIKKTLHPAEEEKMAVIVQKLTGVPHGDVFYPAASGVAQSYNFYPIQQLKAEDGIVHLAMGLGKIVVEGGAALRFCPAAPGFLPQFSTVDDILNNSQRFFYALNLAASAEDPIYNGDLLKLEVDEAADHPAVKALCGTYVPEDHRIRDGFTTSGYPVLTFSGILKHNRAPLPGILADILDMGRKGMGCPVEIEFAANLPDADRARAEFALLQVRPMAVAQYDMDVTVTDQDAEAAFIYSTSVLGNGLFKDVADIVYVKPEDFDPARTREIAADIGRINAGFVKQDRKYLLIGPGRWGSADRWLGVPVTWNDISGVGAMVETAIDKLKADPSQGSHFFNNIISLGISYITVRDNGKDFIDWGRVDAMPVETETRFVRHVKPAAALTIKIDGKTSRAVVWG